MSRNPRKEHPFTKTLKALLAEKGMSIREAASIAGVAPSTLSDWTSGTLPSDYLAVRRLAEKSGTTLAFLLTGQDDTGISERRPPLAELITEGSTLFDGYLKVKIQKIEVRLPDAASGRVQKEELE